MTILVIGGAGGMVAGALARHEGVVAIGRPKADLAAPDTLARALDAHAPRAVICAGAYTQVDAAETHEAEAFRINAEGPAALAAMCAERGVPLVLVSTDFVFDGSQDKAYVEWDQPSPLNAYGRSKRAGEEAVIAAGGVHAVVRTSWIHAPTGKNFVRTMLALGRTRTDVRVVDDQFGAPTYAQHLADPLLLIARTIGEHPDRSGLYHLANEGSCSRATYAAAIFSGARARGGPSADVTPVGSLDFPTPAQRPRSTRLDTTKARTTFGIALPDWRIGLDACLDQIAAGGWSAG